MVKTCRNQNKQRRYPSVTSAKFRKDLWIRLTPKCGLKWDRLSHISSIHLHLRFTIFPWHKKNPVAANAAAQPSAADFHPGSANASLDSFGTPPPPSPSPRTAKHEKKQTQTPFPCAPCMEYLPPFTP